jgi:transposase
VLLPHERRTLARGCHSMEHAMSQKLDSAIATVGIDIGKNSFHVVGLDERGAIVLRQKCRGARWKRDLLICRGA